MVILTEIGGAIAPKMSVPGRGFSKYYHEIKGKLYPMKISIGLLLITLLFSAYTPTGTHEEEEAIFRAVFTNRDVERAIIRVPRWEDTPVQLILLQNEYTADVQSIQLHTAKLLVLNEEDIQYNRINTYYTIDAFKQSGNTASVSFAQWRRMPGQAVAGGYAADVSLVRRKGRWFATRVEHQGDSEE